VITRKSLHNNKILHETRGPEWAASKTTTTPGKRDGSLRSRFNPLPTWYTASHRKANKGVSASVEPRASRRRW
jgi:hypothetical protein